MTHSNAGIMDRQRNQTKSAPGDFALFVDKCNILYTYTLNFLTKKRLCLGSLADAANKQVDVVHVGVEELQPLHNLHWDQIREQIETLDATESTNLSE